MGELQSALDALAALDLDGLPDGALLDHARQLSAAANRLEAELTRVVRRIDVRGAVEHDAAKTAQSWLRGVVRLSGSRASQLVGHGRALEHLPATAAAFAAGLLGADQVEVIAEIATPVNRDLADAQGIDLAEIETALVVVATCGTHRDLQSAVGTYLAKLDTDGPEPDPTPQRSAHLVQQPDGHWTLGGTLDPVGGQKLATALEAVQAASRCAGDLRDRAQRTADALVQLADNALASGELPVLRTVKPHLLATLPLSDLVDPAPSPGAARTGTGATISAAAARWLACDATVTRIVLDPDGLPLDVGRTQRTVPAHIRKAVELRDRHCVFAGCEAPAWFCDVHHLIHWALGGQTSLDNTGLLCERHHTKVHHGYRVERDDTAPPGRRWRTYRPDGTQIVVHPPLRV
ncbi:HNH endonuclease signature motif containing protein [Trujillonella humicola]|uniref:HNH endonuclease signature motif containing protein n=1 Tax=Trujillonella humicola TaxID=3383699 RepID=UPI003905B9CD